MDNSVLNILMTLIILSVVINKFAAYTVHEWNVFFF